MPFLERADHVVDDERVAILVRCEGGVEPRLDLRLVRPQPRLALPETLLRGHRTQPLRDADRQGLVGLHEQRRPAELPGRHHVAADRRAAVACRPRDRPLSLASVNTSRTSHIPISR